MPRKAKQKVEVNSSDSLQGIMQETYNDACLNIVHAQEAIDILKLSVTPIDVDDATKIAKEKGNLLKVKSDSIKIKLDLAKLQSDILKHNGDAAGAIKERSQGEASIDDFDSIREMLNNKGNNQPND